MRPLLKPALRRLWRARETVQIGLDPDRAVVLTDVDTGLADVLSGLDGSHPIDAVVARAQAEGVSRAATTRLLELLRQAGLLDDAGSQGLRLHGLTAEERERLAPDLAALSLHGGTPDGGVREVLQRRKATVAIYGAGRVGSTVATVLAGAGVGSLVVVDESPARPADLAPAGLADQDVGNSRSAGVRRQIFVRAPSTTTPDPTNPATRHPHFAVIAPDEEPDRSLVDGLVNGGVPHLVVRLVETRAIIGPLVVPGRTSCVRCADLSRAARDAAWPKVVAQLLSEPASAVASDIGLATTAGATAALHVLGFLAGDSPPSMDGTLELTMPYSSTRRRTWSPHPACGCRWEHLGSTPEAVEPASA